MFKKAEAGQSKLYAGLAGIAALALFTACTAEEPAQEEPADQDVEQQESATPEGNQGNANSTDGADEQTDATDNTTDGAAAGNDDVYSIIEAVEAEYSGGIIVEADLEDGGSMYDVDVVADNQLYELDVTADGNISVDDTESDDDKIQKADQANLTVTEALDEAFEQYPDASFDEIELEEENGSLRWEIDLDDANGSEIEMEVSAS